MKQLQLLVYQILINLMCLFHSHYTIIEMKSTILHLIHFNANESNWENWLNEWRQHTLPFQLLSSFWRRTAGRQRKRELEWLAALRLVNRLLCFVMPHELHSKLLQSFPFQFIAFFLNYSCATFSSFNSIHLFVFSLRSLLFCGALAGSPPITHKRKGREKQTSWIPLISSFLSISSISLNEMEKRERAGQLDLSFLLFSSFWRSPCRWQRP